MNNLAEVQKTSNEIVAGWVSDTEMMSVMRNSIYPGAKDESIKMVLSYCASASLDPLQKPVHIVGMSVYDSQSNEYVWRDIVMPGIDLYRIKASRSKTHMGTTEPEFGPMMEMDFKDQNGKPVSHRFPEWCRVTVKKMIGDQVAEYTAKEYWLENYATAKKPSTCPNTMWAKRTMAQLAKCTEAQALRRAYPEFCAGPTAEEMEGKVLEGEFNLAANDEGAGVAARDTSPEKEHYPDDKFEANLGIWAKQMQNEDPAKRKTADQVIRKIQTRYQLTAEQIKKIKKAEAMDVEV